MGQGSLKVGDKVRLKEGLVVGRNDRAYTNSMFLREASMVFREVRTVKEIDQDGDITLVENTNGWYYSPEMLEKVEEQTLKETYLVSDNVVKTRDGYIYLITKNALTGYGGGHNISIYNEDLTCKVNTTFDIVEVFERKEEVYMLSDLVNPKSLTSIWKRVGISYIKKFK